MHDHVFADRDEPSVFSAIHLFHIVDAFGVVIEKLQFHFYRIASTKLLEISNVSFEREKGAIGLRCIIRTQAEQQKGLIAGAIENDIVIGHVEMAIVIDPLVLHLVDGAYEGRGEGHRYFLDSCYAVER